MLKLKYILQEKKMLIAIILIILICSIAIAIGVYAQVTNKSTIGKADEGVNTNYEGGNANYEDLKNNFQDIFTNTINKEATAKLNVNYEELVYLKYDIKDEKEGKYSIIAKIPGFKENSQTLQKINKEIYDIFANEILKITNDNSTYAIYNLDYVAYANNNIVSLVIMCKYKKGTNPQRRIIQTYNYDIENDKLLGVGDIINYKNLDKVEVQKKVKDEIKKVNGQMKNIKNQGFNVYLRDEFSDIYSIENTPNFFLGKNNYLYLVYAYGNNKYTSEMDLIIF